MADPSSLAGAWIISKVTAQAIAFASDKAKATAQDLWEQNFAKVEDQFAVMQAALEEAINDAANRAVEELKNVFYANEVRNITTVVETWTKNWPNAMHQSTEYGEHEEKDRLLNEFRTSTLGPAYHGQLLHNVLTGKGTGAGESNSYIQSYEALLFRRLQTDDYFTIQHYYDSCKVFLRNMFQVQIIMFHFRCCAARKKDLVDDWADELKHRLESQKGKLLKCMPGLIRRLKPSFEAEAIAKGHWWHFLANGRTDRSLNHKPGSTLWKIPQRLEESNVTPTRPGNEWKFERELLVETDDPDPITWKEKYQDELETLKWDVWAPKEENEKRGQRSSELHKMLRQSWTRVINCETQKSIHVGGSLCDYINASGDIDDSSPWAKGDLIKVILVKDGGRLAFKMVLMSGTVRMSFREGWLGKEYNPFLRDGVVFELDDVGILQETTVSDLAGVLSGFWSLLQPAASWFISQKPNPDAGNGDR